MTANSALAIHYSTIANYENNDIKNFLLNNLEFSGVTRQHDRINFQFITKTLEKINETDYSLTTKEINTQVQNRHVIDCLQEADMGVCWNFLVLRSEPYITESETFLSVKLQLKNKLIREYKRLKHIRDEAVYQYQAGVLLNSFTTTGTPELLNDINEEEEYNPIPEDEI